MLIDRRVLSQFDYQLLVLCILIPCFGLVVLFSAGYDETRPVQLFSWMREIPSEAFARQLTFLGLGICALIAGLCISPQFLLKYAYLIYGACVVLLIAVDIFGSIVKGSQRWLSMGGFNIQPAEPTKLAVILAMARYLSKSLPKFELYSFKEIIVPGLIFLIPAALIMGQPDLGTATVVLFIGSAMVLFVGVRPKVLLALALPFLIGLYPAWNSLHDYQKRRVLVLLNPELDPKGSGYHINQSKIAVGSGAFFGKGYLEGTQTQLEFLPEHTTDFVFSVLGEEWGFVGCIAVISLYLYFLFRILRVVTRSKDIFPALVVFGIGSLIFFHTAVNIGMVIGLLPVVGIPLPLFSYGGSSMLSCMFSLGLILGFDMRRLIFVFRS